MTTIRTSDGLELFLHDWTLPEPAITVAILHGYGEHAGRYAHVAERWRSRGISCLAADLRGHGRSPGPRGHVDRFEEYHRDADALVDTAKERAAGGPVAVFGHSMGGLLASHWLLSGRGSDLAGVVLSSPYLGLAVEIGSVKKGLGNMMSNLVPKFAQPSGLKGSDVARDPEIAARYDADPLNNKKATARWFTESNEAIASVHRRAGQITAPLLLLYGGDDRVAKADATDRFAAALTGANKTSERLDGYFHELVNEPPAEREAVIDRMGDWLLARAEESAAR